MAAKTQSLCNTIVCSSKYLKLLGQVLLKSVKSLNHLNGDIIKTLICLEAVTFLLLTI